MENNPPNNFLEEQDEAEIRAIEPPRQRRNGVYFFILLCFGVILLYGLKHYSVAAWPRDGVFYDARTLKPKNLGFFQTIKNYIFEPDNIVKGQEDDRINILLLGMGGPGHDGPYLTDTNIILSVKPSAKEVAMISVPRDLGVDLPKYGWRKINHANAFGEEEKGGQGGDYARQVFEKTFDLKIPYYIRVDFKAFEDLINEVGGITINVPVAFTDTQFPGADNAYTTVSFLAGAEQMDGERALTYARSRHGTNGQGSDFARARRQQQVLSALKAKLLSLGTYTNPVRIQHILDSLSTHVTTNLDFGQLMYLASLGRENSSDIISLVLDDGANGLLASFTSPTGAYLLGPRSGKFDTVNQNIKDIFDKRPKESTTPPTNLVTVFPSTTTSPAAATIKIEIQNGTWRLGLASRLQEKLKTQGFTVPTIGNSVRRPIAVTSLYIINPSVSKELTANLAKALSLEPVATLPAWLGIDYDNPATSDNESGQKKYAEGVDVLVTIGEDYVEK